MNPQQVRDSGINFASDYGLAAVTFHMSFTLLQGNTYSTKIYGLLHFEHKNDVTIIIKLQRATRSSVQKFDVSLCSKCNRTWIFMEQVLNE